MKSYILRPLNWLNRFTLSLVILVGCNEQNNINNTQQTLGSKDTSVIGKFLFEHKEDIISNDSIILSLRLGMTRTEAENHLAQKEMEGSIIRNRNKIYCLLNTYEYCSVDYNNAHHIVADLKLNFDSRTEKLSSVYATLYGPRFYITPYKFDESIEEKIRRQKSNPVAQDYRRIVGDSIYYTSFRQLHPKDYIRLIQIFYDDSFMPLFKNKYGDNYISMFEVDSIEKNVWISEGRYVELRLKRNYESIALDYLSLTNKPNIDSVNNLVYIGAAYYSTVKEAFLFKQSLNEVIPKLRKSFDSSEMNKKKQEEKLASEKARSSGI